MRCDCGAQELPKGRKRKALIFVLFPRFYARHGRDWCADVLYGPSNPRSVHYDKPCEVTFTRLD